jgi:hypothetical protein
MRQRDAHLASHINDDERNKTMKKRYWVLALAAMTSWASVQAADPAPAPAQASASSAMPMNADEWVRFLSDFTRNGEMLADPKKFIAALSAVSEPSFLISATSSVLDPNLYLQSMNSLMDPKAYANYARAMDPNVVGAWTQALLDPQFINAMGYVMTDPNKLMRWLMAPMDPKVLNAAMQMLNPNVYLRLATAPADPRVAKMATAPMNPNWYGAWMNSLTSPGSYGPTMGGWMNPGLMPSLPAFPTFVPVMPMPTR